MPNYGVGIDMINPGGSKVRVLKSREEELLNQGYKKWIPGLNIHNEKLNTL